MIAVGKMEKVSPGFYIQALLAEMSGGGWQWSEAKLPLTAANTQWEGCDHREETSKVAPLFLHFSEREAGTADFTRRQ